jgi:hypothetical protein
MALPQANSPAAAWDPDFGALDFEVLDFSQVG